MIVPVFEKDPSEKLDYGINYSKWLDTDTIASSVWQVPNALTSSNDSNTATVATIWLSGGVLYNTYDVVNTVTTAAGRIVSRTIKIAIVHR